jgi:hypothetical protein
MVRTVHEIAGQPACMERRISRHLTLKIIREPVNFLTVLPWLERLGLALQIEPFHREILKRTTERCRPPAVESFWRAESFDSRLGDSGSRPAGSLLTG